MFMPFLLLILKRNFYVCYKICTEVEFVLKSPCNIPGSSSGRTEDSGSSNGGSNPSPGV